jgi:hypothetical protein
LPCVSNRKTLGQPLWRVKRRILEESAAALACQHRACGYKESSARKQSWHFRRIPRTCAIARPGLAATRTSSGNHPPFAESPDQDDISGRHRSSLHGALPANRAITSFQGTHSGALLSVTGDSGDRPDVSAALPNQAVSTRGSAILHAVNHSGAGPIGPRWHIRGRPPALSTSDERRSNRQAPAFRARPNTIPPFAANGPVPRPTPRGSIHCKLASDTTLTVCNKRLPPRDRNSVRPFALWAVAPVRRLSMGGIRSSLRAIRAPLADFGPCRQRI